jgi:hypothetical protein
MGAFFASILGRRGGTAEPSYWLPSVLSIGFLLLWTILLTVIGLGQREGAQQRVITFSVALGVATIVATSSLLTASPMIRAIGATAAGTAISVVGIFAGATVGLPLVPIGMGFVITGLVAAEGSAAPRRVFLACTVVAAGVLTLLAAIALLGHGQR